ncbi:hypothetical protein [Streptomyces sp. NPDC059134]|uniref:hypothetical protein n=1 Tax=Streptomyces sp. NPDC059134 TaxID=3346738 RepID=UPI00369FC317
MQQDERAQLTGPAAALAAAQQQPGGAGVNGGGGSGEAGDLDEHAAPGEVGGAPRGVGEQHGRGPLGKVRDADRAPRPDPDPEGTARGPAGGAAQNLDGFAAAPGQFEHAEGAGPAGRGGEAGRGAVQRVDREDGVFRCL